MRITESGTIQQSWLQREYHVVLASVAMGYVQCFYIGRIGSGVLWETSENRKTRISLLLGISVLFLWMAWAFVKAVITPPGFAKDHVPQQKWPPERCPTADPSHPPIYNLHPEYRYCGLDKIIKPFRTHHCSNCQACVLKYDHHCSWIGQCVGARNHKFFVNFLQATSAFTLYYLGTILTPGMRPALANGARMSAVFAFTAAIVATAAFFSTRFLIYHTKLILLGQTTLERFQLRKFRQKQLQQNRSFSWWERRKKQKVIEDCTRKWGDIDTECNIWWLGSRRRGWEDVMGKSVWGWFLPIGQSQNDGLSYPINSRFGDDGGLKKREEWPEELR
ncbi:zf-DHHC-domain-containing protein [Pluteus cervinus]|uniref:Zf-DHHC-domain-containing protein n=1 Tax=Pluteus cervinus TaxID=181527 RepID=A0ACD3ANV9_9AGAR|nr:zf-DHHC-domain-containing protein [Pluteus cervinus]